MEVNSLHPGNPVNEATNKGVNTHSRFEIVRRLFQTMRYSELTPHFVMESVPKDLIKLRSRHDVRSYTLKAPIMSDISIKKDYFSVPLQALLPINADKLYVNPVSGDDVVALDVNCCIEGRYLLAYLKNILLSIQTLGVTGDDALSPEEAWSIVLRQWTILEYFLSSGSLCRNLGYSFGSLFENQYLSDPDVQNKFDAVSEALYSAFIEDVNGVRFRVLFIGDDSFVTVDPLQQVSSEGILCLSDFFQRLRENPLVSLVFDEDSSDAGLIELLDPESHGLLILSSIAAPEDAEMDDFNFLRVAAYQMVCHHFYSNDHVDYIYSAELFRQLMFSYAAALNGDSYQTFSYNGVSTQYDSLAGIYLNAALTACSSDSTPDMLDSQIIAGYNYVSTLFSFRRSLRFVDYFTGARPQPLAVGDTTVAVNNNLVDVVDVSRRTQVQRFLNSVSRAGRKIVNYISDIFHVTPAYDYHDPAWLAHTADKVHVVETENTGDYQFSEPNSISGIFRTNAERYAFEFECDRPSILIGITYFDIPRCYAFSNDKQNLSVDRFDMFNPFMQFIGDQSINLTELGVHSSKPFAYTLRHMQYKQSYDIACGGFVDNLPAFAFVQPIQDVLGVGHISPDWIRAKSFELDRFYVSLTGRTLASYFHFMVVNINDVDAKRPMAYAPSIL